MILSFNHSPRVSHLTDNSRYDYDASPKTDYLGILAFLRELKDCFLEIVLEHKLILLAVLVESNLGGYLKSKVLTPFLVALLLQQRNCFLKLVFLGNHFEYLLLSEEFH